MRQRKAPKRGRVVPILLAGSVGYLLGSAHITAFRSTDLSAAEAVALRFPQDWKDASIATAAAVRTAAMKLHAPKNADVASADVGAAVRTGNAQLALLSPEPMVPPSTPQAVSDAGPQAGEEQAAIQTASAEQVDTAPVPAGPMPGMSAAPPAALPQAQTASSKPALAAAPPAPAPKVAAVAPHPRINDRPGYILNDTQIASIKERLHLTPDQEEMWPAVEAALRNIAYTRAQQARAQQAYGSHGRGAPGNDTQTAAVDPNAVQGLKSAAVPLIMSFNAEQKEEVRNLAHVMGLDQLASQF
jgi:hypothetical protein